VMSRIEMTVVEYIAKVEGVESFCCGKLVD
jgi:hypothetical protein